MTKKGRMVSGFPRKVSDINGTVHVMELPVGRIDRENGNIEPYQYRLKEILPPEGFAANPQIYTFTFENGEGGYCEDGTLHTVIHEQNVKNDVTKIYLEKRELEGLGDSGTEGIFVEGACMAVYRISEINDKGVVYLHRRRFGNRVDYFIRGEETPDYRLISRMQLCSGREESSGRICADGTGSLYLKGRRKGNIFHFQQSFCCPGTLQKRDS